MAQMKCGNILIYHIGQLGDTLALVPALRVIRDQFPDAKITSLCDEHVSNKYVKASDVLEASGLSDNFMFYPAGHSAKVKMTKIFKLAGLLFHLRSCNYDTLFYLVPSRRTASQIRRDILFFRLTGIKCIIGKDDFYSLPSKLTGQPLPVLPQEADLLLSRLASSGICVPSPGRGVMDINISDNEKKAVEKWLEGLPSDGYRKWIAVGPGSKMPVKIWPMERYLEVISTLIDKYDIWPVIFGGQEDKSLAQKIISELGRGYVAAGTLNVRCAIAAMKRCQLFLGNDSGAMHMAVTAGLKCVALFSSRDFPGNWYPYGDGHKVFRTTLPCEGCMLVECKTENMECILSINCEQVTEACESILEKQD